MKGITSRSAEVTVEAYMDEVEHQMTRLRKYEDSNAFAMMIDDEELCKAAAILAMMADEIEAEYESYFGDAA